MKFTPPFERVNKPDVNDFSSVDIQKTNQRIEKYTKKYIEGNAVGSISFEDSAIGKIQKELQSQTKVMREYAANQKENRIEDKAEAKKDAPKKFLRDVLLCLVSAIVGGAVTFFFDNYGTLVVNWILKLFQ